MKIFAVNPGTVGYLGPPGTFTHRAVQADPELTVAAHQPFPDLAAIFEAVATGRVGQAVVAWDNSLAGPVPDAMDLLAGAGGQVQVRRDLVMPVRLCLWGRRGAKLADISTVMSHPHALAQCARWVQAMLPAAACTPASSTAAALGSAAADRSGGTAAAAPQGPPAAGSPVVVLARDISGTACAETRFMVIGPEPAARQRDSCRTVLGCSAGQVGEAGSGPLRTALACLARGGVRAQVLGVLPGAEAKRVEYAR